MRRIISQLSVLILMWAAALLWPASMLAGQQLGDPPPTAPGKPSAGATLTKASSVTWTWSAATDSGGFIGFSLEKLAASFQTQSVSDYRIDIGTSAGGSQIVMGASTGGNLSFTRSGLADGTYFARVLAIDNLGQSGAYSENSDPIIVDTTAPTISGLATNSITTSGATITWTTNESASTQIHYGTNSGSYPLTSSLDSSLVTSHSVALSGLSAGIIYYYQALSTDQAGNTATSSQASFTTTASGSTASPTSSSTPTATVSSTSSPKTTTSVTPSLTTSPTTSTSSTPTETTSASPTAIFTTESGASPLLSVAPVVAGTTGGSSLSAWFWWPLLILLLLLFMFIWWYIHRRHEPRESSPKQAGQK